MTKREFRNLLCIIHSIDPWELPERWDQEQHRMFLNDPIKVFLLSDEEYSEEIWAAMMCRTKHGAD